MQGHVVQMKPLVSRGVCRDPRLRRGTSESARVNSSTVNPAFAIAFTKLSPGRARVPHVEKQRTPIPKTPAETHVRAVDVSFPRDDAVLGAIFRGVSDAPVSTLSPCGLFPPALAQEMQTAGHHIVAETSRTGLQRLGNSDPCLSESGGWTFEVCFYSAVQSVDTAPVMHEVVADIAFEVTPEMSRYLPAVLL